jgi:hypothetical protein
VPVAQLWKVVQEEAKETSTRQWAYTVINGLSKDARSRLKEARKAGAVALVDEALEIADEARPGGARPVTNAAEATATRLATDVRLRLAGMFDRDSFGDRPAQVGVQLSFGQQYLEALRQCRTIPSGLAQAALPSGEPDVEVVTRENE